MDEVQGKIISRRHQPVLMILESKLWKNYNFGVALSVDAQLQMKTLQNLPSLFKTF